MSFNFDLIFTGTDEEQACKAHHLNDGLQELIRENSVAFAEYVVKGNDDQALKHFAKIKEYEDASHHQDPRFEALAKRLDAAKKAEVEQLVKEVIASSPVLSALDRIVRSKNKAPAPSEEPQQPEAQK